MSNIYPQTEQLMSMHNRGYSNNRYTSSYRKTKDLTNSLIVDPTNSLMGYWGKVFFLTDRAKAVIEISE